MCSAAYCIKCVIQTISIALVSNKLWLASYANAITFFTTIYSATLNSHATIYTSQTYQNVCCQWHSQTQ